MITCDEIKDAEETKTVLKNITCETKSFCISLAFLLITIALLIAVSIYCYLIKYRAKNLLSFYDTVNKLNEFCVDCINWKRALKI